MKKTLKTMLVIAMLSIVIISMTACGKKEENNVDNKKEENRAESINETNKNNTAVDENNQTTTDDNNTTGYETKTTDSLPEENTGKSRNHRSTIQTIRFQRSQHLFRFKLKHQRFLLPARRQRPYSRNRPRTPKRIRRYERIRAKRSRLLRNESQMLHRYPGNLQRRTRISAQP